MQKTIYRNTELIYADEQVTIQTSTNHRVLNFLVFGSIFFLSVMSLVGSVHHHKWHLVVFGVLFLLFSGTMLCLQFSVYCSGCVLDRKNRSFRRGKVEIPIEDVTSIEVEKNGSSYLLWFIIQERPKQLVAGMSPFKQEADAVRLATELSIFMDIPVTRT